MAYKARIKNTPPKSVTRRITSKKVNYRYLTFIFITIFAFSTGAIAAITIGINAYLFLASPVIGFILAYLVARENYHKMISLGLDEYNKQYRYNVCCHRHIHKSPFIEDSGNPLDPASRNYWAIGPGSSNYHDR